MKRGAYDIEAEEWVKARCIGVLWYDDKGVKHYVCDTDKGHTIKPKEVLRRGLVRMLDVAARGGPRQWWAHNGGKYDITLLLPVILELGARCTGIVAAGRVLSLDITLDGVTIKLCDSFAVVSSSLAKASDSFKLASSKLYTKEDYATVHLWSEEKLHDGCFADCQIVIELLDKCDELLKGFGGSLKLTAASSSLSVMKAKCKLIDLHNDSDINRWCREAYYGGRVEVYRHTPRQDIAYWDVNSSYPFSLAGDMPTEPIRMAIGRQASADFDTYPMSVVEATVNVPNVYVPPLPVRDEDGGLYFPTGTFRGKWVAEELRFAVECGATIQRIHACQSFKTGRPFRSFVSELYELKRNSKGALREMAKLLLNSGYGKLGEKPEKERLVITSAEEGAALLFKGNARCLGRNGDTRFVTQELEFWPRHTHYAQAATVTARSRILLAKAFMAADLLCYGDTDSIHAAKSSPFIDSQELGALKLEASVMRGKYYAPKIYRLEIDGLHTLHAKGFAIGKGDKEPTEERRITSIRRFDTLVTARSLKSERQKLVKQLLKSETQEPERETKAKVWLGVSNKRKAIPNDKDGDTEAWDIEELRSSKHLRQLSPALK